MTDDRYNELSKNIDLQLTSTELSDGWFFCCDWDGLLINQEHEEAKCCSCLIKANGDK